MKIAFLTPEFVTEYGFGGGLGNYLNRFTKELVKRGHQVEIFVSSQKPEETILGVEISILFYGIKDS